MKPTHFYLSALLLAGFAVCVASCDRPNLSGAPADAPAPSVHPASAPIASRDAARMAASGVDSLLEGKTLSPTTQNFFSTYNNSTHTYARNPDCFAARIDTTCV